MLGIPEHKLRVIAPDVGGGFGSKIFHYAEEAIVTWASRRVGRPVKWTAERTESFMSDAHGRDHVSHAELALSEDGDVFSVDRLDHGSRNEAAFAERLIVHFDYDDLVPEPPGENR